MKKLLLVLTLALSAANVHAADFSKYSSGYTIDRQATGVFTVNNGKLTYIEKGVVKHTCRYRESQTSVDFHQDVFKLDAYYCETVGTVAAIKQFPDGNEGAYLIFVSGKNQENTETYPIHLVNE